MANPDDRNFLRELNDVFSRKSAPQANINAIAELIVAEFNLVGCSIYRTENDGTLKAIGFAGYHQENPTDVNPSSSILGRAMAQKNTIWVTDLNTLHDPLWARKGVIAELGITTIAAVPITQLDKSVGVLIASSNASDPLTTKTVQLLQTLAGMLPVYDAFAQVLDPQRTTESIKNSLRTLRKTQKELAEAIEISSATLSSYFARRRSIPEKTLLRILDNLTDPASPLRANAAISERPLEPESNTLEAVATSIPHQSSLVRFGVSENKKLNLIPTLVDENDYKTIESLRSELLSIQGPINTLMERYAHNPNVPQATLFRPLISKYTEELSKAPQDINYTILFARGSRLYAAQKRASQQIASGEWPDLDTQENEAVDTICDLHGPLIMASAAGRKLVEDAHQYEVPTDVYQEDQRTIEEFGQVIAAETEILEPETAKAYLELTSKTEGDPQPTRSRGLGIAATGSALTVVVGGAAWYGAGGTVATLVVPAAAIGAAGLVGGFFWEAIKTMPRFKKATSAVGGQFEKALTKAEKHADDRETALLKGMADLVDRNKSLFAKVAKMRPEFGWAKKYLRNSKPTVASIFDVNQTVENAVAPLAESAARANFSIRVHQPDGRLLAVGDQEEVHMALTGIITNAIIHSKPLRASDERKSRQRIDVEVRVLKGFKDNISTTREIRVDITDWGIGIPEEHLPRIFEIGYRGSENPNPGRGTGLSVIKTLMEKQGGEISLTSNPKNGSTFSLSFIPFEDS